MIGTTDGFLSDKSIRKLNDLVNTKYNIINDSQSDFYRGGGNF